MSLKAALGGIVLVGLACIAIGVIRSKPANPPSNQEFVLPEEPAPVSKSSPTRQTFADDPCSEDCSGHQAGYDWAERNEIDAEDACDDAGDTSNSPSFAEGCKAYVEGRDPDDEADPDDDSSGDSPD